MSGLDRLREWLRRSVPAGNLAAKTLKSGVWVGALNVSDRLLQLGMVVILASLLGPAEFGLMGIALVTINALRRFSRLGINEALIQQEDENVDDYLNTTWSMQTLRGLFLGTILFLGAPLIAGVFNEPEVTPVLRVISVSPLLLGLRNPATVYFQKNLEFHKQFVYQISGSLLYTIVALGIAFFVVESVWALVTGYVVADLTRLFVSYWLDDYRPFPALNFDMARELFGYGKWITGSGIVLFLINEGDDALVGVLLSAGALGLYQMGYRLGKAPSTEITQVVSSVLFPTYSKLQDDMESFREVFFQIVRATTLISFPVGVGIIVVAPTFIRAFMGQQWLEAVRPMQLIAVYGILVSFAATFGPVWKALGRPDYVTKLGVLRLILMGILVVPAMNAYGVTGMAAVVTGVYLFAIFPLDVHLVVKSVETTHARLLSEITYPLIASALMGAIVLFVRQNIDLAPVFEFAVLVVVGAVSYAAWALLLETRFDWGLERDVRRVMSAVRG